MLFVVASSRSVLTNALRVPRLAVGLQFTLRPRGRPRKTRDKIEKRDLTPFLTPPFQPPSLEADDPASIAGAPRKCFGVQLAQITALAPEVAPTYLRAAFKKTRPRTATQTAEVIKPPSTHSGQLLPPDSATQYALDAQYGG